MSAVSGISDSAFEIINKFLQSYSFPLHFLPLVLLVAVIFLALGYRLFKVVIIVLMLLVGGGFAYMISKKNWLITVAAALGSGLIAFPLHFLFGVLLTGLAMGGLASQILYYMIGFDMSLIGFAAGMILGIALGVIFFKPAMIFTTSAFSATAITLSVLLFVQEKTLTKSVELNTVNLNLTEVAVLGAAVLAAGIGLQWIVEVHRKNLRKKAKAEAREKES